MLCVYRLPFLPPPFPLSIQPYYTYLARNADLLVDQELVDVRPLVSGHLHDVPALRIAHDRTVTAWVKMQQTNRQNN